MNEHILEGLVVLAGLGALSQLLAWHLRIPSILLLLPFGILAGPVFGVVDPHELLGSATFPLFSLGAAVSPCVGKTCVTCVARLPASFRLDSW